MNSNTPKTKVTLQPDDIFRTIGIKNKPEYEHILSVSYRFLTYLEVGSSIKTSFAEFTKISEDLIQIDVNLNTKLTVDSLASGRIINLPI